MIRVIFAPCSIEGNGAPGDCVVVRRPRLHAQGHGDALAYRIEAYPADGPRAFYDGKREPVFSEDVFCSGDQTPRVRDRWDIGTGGEPGKPRGNSQNPPAAYIGADLARVEAAIERARAAIVVYVPA